jgi:hypothetical protein
VNVALSEMAKLFKAFPPSIFESPLLYPKMSKIGKTDITSIGGDVEEPLSKWDALKILYQPLEQKK